MESQVIYKPVNGQLRGHFGFKLSENGSIESANHIYCFHCHKSFAYHGSKSSLIYHLRRKHPAKFQAFQISKCSQYGNFKEMCTISTDPAVLDEIYRETANPSQETAHNDLDIACAYWIAKSGRPVSIVQDAGLLDVMRIVSQNRNFQLPSKYVVNKLLTEMYDSKLEIVKKSLIGVEHVAISFDFWTSMDNETYFNIIIHRITDKWTLHNLVLECHPAQIINDVCRKFAGAWNLDGKIKAIITHDPNNSIEFSETLGFPLIPCVAHSLQDSIFHGLETAGTEELLEKCRKMVAYVTINSAKIMKLPEAGNTPILNLHKDVPKRWNSIFLMLVILLQCKDAIKAYISIDTQCPYAGEFLSEEDWDQISKYAEVFDLFSQATVLLGGLNYVPCSCVLPLLASLRKHMVVNTFDPPYIAIFKMAIIEDFKNRVSETRFIDVLKIATALDPRYKNLKCITEDERKATWAFISNETALRNGIYEINRNKTPEPVNPYNSDLFDRRVRLLDSDPEENVPIANDELGYYKMEMKASDYIDPLEWWKINEPRYPKLAKMAKSVLCIPATSSPCELAFSYTGYVVDKTRSSIEPNAVNMLMCLGSWLSDKV